EFADADAIKLETKGILDHIARTICEFLRPDSQIRSQFQNRIEWNVNGRLLAVRHFTSPSTAARRSMAFATRSRQADSALTQSQIAPSCRVATGPMRHRVPPRRRRHFHHRAPPTAD